VPVHDPRLPLERNVIEVLVEYHLDPERSEYRLPGGQTPFERFLERTNRKVSTQSLTTTVHRRRPKQPICKTENSTERLVQ
jgi:hypothetical protein